MTTSVLTFEERLRLSPHFTDLDGGVFALTNLPEVVKGALYARYSRSPKSLRRLFLDEFATDVAPPSADESRRTDRAAALYEKVFVEYGDDSVAQLGGFHVAVEGASNVLTKVLEWGRLMSYLEQSTRYIPYTDRPGGRWKYVIPAEIEAIPDLRARYAETLDDAFATYARLLEGMDQFYRGRYPRDATTSEGAWSRSIRAKALDAVRGLLPAATQSNLGLYGTGQAYEALLLRMRASPLSEVRDCADAMLRELRKVAPAFFRRVDLPDRGGLWSQYLANTRAATATASKAIPTREASPPQEVALTEFDPEGELKVVAAAMYGVTDLADADLLEMTRNMGDSERAAILSAYVGERTNRRHKPGRAFERTGYRFDVLTDYGAFRDLQRHRLLTLEWQTLGVSHGFAIPDDVGEAGLGADFERVMRSAADLHAAILAACSPEVAAYAVPMAYRIRFYMQLNAREAMHLIELRSSPQGHAAYRRVAQLMHRLIEEKAGHRAIAAAMKYVDHETHALERLSAEKALEARARR